MLFPVSRPQLGRRVVTPAAGDARWLGHGASRGHAGTRQRDDCPGGEDSQARSRFAQLTAAGLSATIFFYVGINLMMVMGLAPVVGIPLPLFSYGGSSMLTIMTCVGIILAVENDSKTGSRRFH